MGSKAILAIALILIAARTDAAVISAVLLAAVTLSPSEDR